MGHIMFVRIYLHKFLIAFCISIVILITPVGAIAEDDKESSPPISCEELVLSKKVKTLFRLTIQWLDGEGKDPALRKQFFQRIFTVSTSTNPFDQLSGLQSNQIAHTVEKFNLAALNEKEWSKYLQMAQRAVREIEKNEKQIEEVDEKTSKAFDFQIHTLREENSKSRGAPYWLETPNDRSFVVTTPSTPKDPFLNLYEFHSQTKNLELLFQLNLKKILKKSKLKIKIHEIDRVNISDQKTIDERRFLANIKVYTEDDIVSVLAVIDIFEQNLRVLHMSPSKITPPIYKDGAVFFATTRARSNKKSSITLNKIDIDTGKMTVLHKEKYDPVRIGPTSLYLSPSDQIELLHFPSGLPDVSQTLFRLNSHHQVDILDNPFPTSKYHGLKTMIYHNTAMGKTYAMLTYEPNVRIYEYDHRSKTYNLIFDKPEPRYTNSRFLEFEDGSLFVILMAVDVFNKESEMQVFQLNFVSQDLDLVQKTETDKYPMYINDFEGQRIFGLHITTGKYTVSEFVPSNGGFIAYKELEIQPISQNSDINPSTSVKSDPDGGISVLHYNSLGQLELITFGKQ